MLVTMTRDCSVTYINTKLVCYLQDNLVCHGDGKQACVASESTILCAREWGFQNALLKHPLQTNLLRHKLISPLCWEMMTRGCGVAHNTSFFVNSLKNKLVLQVMAQSFVWGRGIWFLISSSSSQLLEASIADQALLQACFTFILGDNDDRLWCHLQHKLVCHLLEKRACVASDSTISCVMEISWMTCFVWLDSECNHFSRVSEWAIHLDLNSFVMCHLGPNAVPESKQFSE